MTAPRTLLIIAAEFPPLKTIGRIRTVKFAEHLLAHGWKPVVITVEPSGLEPNYDASLLREIADGVEVIRVPLRDYESDIARLAKQLLGRGDTATAAPSAAPAPKSGPKSDPSQARPTAGGGLMDKAHALVRHVFRHYIYIPDSYVFWTFAAARRAREVCAERQVDAIYTTLPAFSSMIAGHRLRRQTGLPWIADYRDLWFGDVLREWLPRWRQRMELWLERRLLRRADVIVTVSEQKTAYMRRLHPDLRARWETLTNGFDVELYSGRARQRPFDDPCIEFVYTGRLFKNRRGHAFAEALGRIARSDPALAARARVRIFGGVEPVIRQRYDDILARDGIGHLFAFEGDVPYQTAMQAQVDCDYLLLIVDTGETSDGVIPGKLFEYVASGRPMFALCDPGATPDIIQRANLGVVVGAEDVDACERELRRVLASPVPRAVEPDEAYLAQFDRRAITTRFATLLDEVTHRRSPAEGPLA
ncbi:glycosyltransferase [Methyloversatilis sp.]|uniref:glycosyltransferase n=1 Tax=Methyloversatilis sp. TaxID=2569862 RepID=UPI003F6FD2F1